MRPAGGLAADGFDTASKKLLYLKSVGRFHFTAAAHWLWDNVLGSDPDAEPEEPTPAWLQNQFDEALKMAEEHTRVPHSLDGGRRTGGAPH